MAILLIDTNIVSYQLKRDSRAALYDPHLLGHHPAISFQTTAELYRWAILDQWGQKRLANFLADISAYMVLPSDDETAWHWARITAIKGRPIATADAWIAATALRHQIPLMTHNRRHFEHIPNLQIISEA